MSSAAAIAFAGIRAQDQSNALPGRGSCGESDNGIVRSGEAITFTYDYESRVTLITKPGMTTNTFSYNGLDTRVGVSDSLGSRNFKRNGIGVTAPVLSDGLANYTPSGEVRGGVKTTFHSALKNADIQSSSSVAVSSSRVYDAFGNDLSVTGSWKSPFAYAGQFGYQLDVDTGLKLLGHRYYDSDTGRFLTRDPIKDGRNWYGYCGNNPTTGADPTGEIFETLLDLAGIALDLKDIYDDPRNPWAWGYLGWSVLATIIPVVPGSWSARVVKLGAFGLDDFVDAGKVMDDLPHIKPGATGGSTAGKPFFKKVKDQAKAENAAHSGVCTCVFCRQATGNPQVDHAVPRSPEGDATIDNAQIAYPHCNQSKGNRGFPVNPPSEYVGPWPPPWFLQ